MKKTKKVLFTVMLSLIFLGGCSGDDPEQTDSTASEDEAVGEDEANAVANDNTTYFFMFDGKKYNAGDKISTLAEIGYKLDEDVLDEDVLANQYMIGGGTMYNSSGDQVFTVVPFNAGTSTVKLGECQIGGFTLTDDYAEDDANVYKFEVYGGIKLGSTQDEVKEAFGEPTEVRDLDDGVRYEYDTDEVYLEYSFTFNADGKVTAIAWENLEFAQ